MTPPLLTRRQTLLSAVAGLAVGCDASNRPTLSQRLNSFVAGDGDPAQALAAAGFVVLKGGAPAVAMATGRAQMHRADRPFKPQTKLRAASVSKLAVAMLALQLEIEGTFDLDEDVRPAFGGLLSNPNYPDRAITMRQLLSHTSSVRDPEAYWAPLPSSIRDLLPGAYVTAPDGVRDADTGPGAWFEYANFNYGLAATFMEQATGQRFDRLVKVEVLDRLDLEAGFNWSGVSLDERREAATLYRRRDGVWHEQMDGEDILTAEEPFFLSEDGASLDRYRPGQNGTLFSPQGGLRASLADMARLATAIQNCDEMQSSLWTFDALRPNGNDEDGAFRTFGLGTFIHEPEASPWPGVRLIGHHGEAYGFWGGAWWAPERDVTIAYGVTGVPDDAPPPKSWHPAMTQWEQTLLDLGIEAASR